jgi:hypothetical protein
MRRSLLAPGLACLAALCGASPAVSQTLADYDYEYLSFRGIGADIGYIWPNKVEPTELYSVRLDLGYLGPGVRIIPSISYWRSRFNDQELEDLATRLNQQPDASVTPESLGPIEWSDLSFSVDGHFVWNTPFNLMTFLGAGFGFHALNGQGPAIDDTLVEDLLDAISAGASGIGGFEIQPTQRFRVYAEGRYTAMNSIQYLTARGGIQLMFGTDGDARVGGAVPAPGAREGRVAQ